jgi:rod shape-determining protein MreC
VYQRRRARILVALLLVTAVVLVSLDVRGGDDSPLAGVRSVATSVFRPIQDGVVRLVSPIGEAASGLTDLFSVRSDNQQLRAQVEQLEQRRRSLTDLERENTELRELLAIRDRLELETVGARAVALAPSSFEWTITIDVGSTDGVERGMPVIDGDGLVGRVIQVTPSASRVLLAIDPNFFAASRSSRTGEIGTMNGRGGDPILFQPLDREGDIEVGDELVTSSYQGGAFPGGIPIGTVIEVVDTGQRDARQFLVSPFVDFTRLHHLQVVLHAPVEEVPPFDGSEGLDFERPPVSPTLEPDEESDADGDDADGDDADGDDADGDDGDGEGDGDDEEDP